MSRSLPYRYDPTAFREVFEHHFTYLAGVQRNSHRYAERWALHDPGTDRRWSYRQLWNDVESLAGGWAAVGVGVGHVVVLQLLNGPEDRTLNMTPWFHRGGLYAGGPNPVFYVGAEAVALRQFDASTVLDWVQGRQLTFLIGAPTNLALLSAEQERRPRDLSSLRGIVTMGAPLDRARSRASWPSIRGSRNRSSSACPTSAGARSWSPT